MIEHNFGGDADRVGAGAAGRKFVAPNPVGLLDFVGTEMLLIGEGKDAEDVLKGDGADAAEQGEDRLVPHV